MGKKKSKNKKVKLANTSTSNAGHKKPSTNGVSKKKSGFGVQKKAPEETKDNLIQEDLRSQEKKHLQKKKKQNIEQKKRGPADDVSPKLGKRQAQGGRKGPIRKKKKQTLMQPGRFVMTNISSPERNDSSSEGTPKKSPSNSVTDLCKVNQSEDSNLGLIENWFGTSGDSLEDSSDESFLDSDSEDDFSDDDEFSSEEDCEEEFFTDTDYSDSSQVWSDDSSGEDDVYDPGDRYTDVIVRKGEAKYSEISSSKIKFQDESSSHIVDYFSDNEGSNRKKSQPVKSSEEHLDVSKAVVLVGGQLDRPRNLQIEETTAVKGKKVVCSQDCSHDQTSPGLVDLEGIKESPLSSLKCDNNEEIRQLETVEEPEVAEDHESAEEVPAEETTEICEEEEDPGSAKFYNAIDSHHVLLHLTEGIHFHGNLSIKLVAGSASVLGYKLDIGETVAAHAPMGYSSVSITPNPSDSMGEWKESHNLKEMFFEEDLKAIEGGLTTTHAILLLHKMSNVRVKMVNKYSSNRVFPNMTTYKRPRPFASTEYILQCRFNFHTRQNFHVNPDWEWIRVEEKSRIVVSGGKNVGKTSLMRYLLNENVKKYGKILLIDLDIGQPEISLPQTVSMTLLDRPILGMGCFVDRQPDKSYLFGDLNVANDPQRYFECVSKLIQDIQAEEQLRNVPWIVNTMGYVRGVGLELMVALLRIISPTDVVQIEHDIQLENFDSVITDNLVNGWSFTILDGEVSRLGHCEKFKTFTYQTMVSENLVVDLRKSRASETRQMSILAHLGGVLDGDCDWITQSRPICVPLDKLKIFNLTDEDIDEQHMNDLLIANLVYLCKKSDDSDILQSLGIGIVRGIDENLQMLYLLPSTRHNLDQVNSLAICHITLPPQLILNQSSGVQGELPYVYNTNESISSRNVATKAFRPESAIVNMYAKN